MTLDEQKLTQDIGATDSSLEDFAVNIKQWKSLILNPGQDNEDWTPAINSAINYIISKIPSGKYSGFNRSPAGVPYLYFPAGKYQVYDTINLFSFIEIRGQNRFSTQIKFMAEDRPLFYAGYNSNDPNYALLNDNYKFSKNIIIQDIKLIGINDKSKPHTTYRIKNHAIKFDGLIHSYLKNMEIEYFYGNGLEMNKIEWVTFEDVVVRYCRIGCNIDASVSDMPDKTAKDNVTNTFNRCRFWYNHQGVSLKLTNNNIFYRCIMESNVGSVYNMTTNGQFDGTILQSDEFYLPSIGIDLVDTFETVFRECYFECQYIDILVQTAFSIYFEKCFFNPADGTSAVHANGVEPCSRHDIMFRKNYFMAPIEKNSENWYTDADGYAMPNNRGETNQAFVLLYGKRDSSGKFLAGHGKPINFNDCWFSSSTSMAATKTNEFKTIRFTFDDYEYPSFSNCLGLGFEDNNSVFSVVDTFICRPYIEGTAVYKGNYQSPLTTKFGHIPTENPDMYSLLKSNHSWTDNEKYNSFLFAYSCWGSGNQKSVYLTEKIKIGQSSVSPKSGTWSIGDFVYNSSPTESGITGSKYIILGWSCTSGGSPGTWVQCRVLTGN